MWEVPKAKLTKLYDIDKSLTKNLLYLRLNGEWPAMLSAGLTMILR